MAFPRKALDQRFAVLLMRSTYDAVDALDFIAMVPQSIQMLCHQAYCHFSACPLQQIRVHFPGTVSDSVLENQTGGV